MINMNNLVEYYLYKEIELNVEQLFWNEEDHSNVENLGRAFCYFMTRVALDLAKDVKIRNLIKELLERGDNNE